MPYLILGAALWAFTMLAMIVHVIDVNCRFRVERLNLDKYNRTRPVEWLLACMILFAAAAGALGATEAGGFWESSADVLGRFQAVFGAAVLAVALVYVGSRGSSWLVWAKDQFLASQGATTTQAGEVWVNVNVEALAEARLVRDRAWKLYAAGCVPLLVTAFRFSEGLSPLVAPIALFAGFAGGVVFYTLLSTLPTSEEDEEW